MEGPQIKISLSKLHSALKEGEKELRILVKQGLEQMAERHQIEFKHVIHMVDDVIDKIKEESLRFNPRLPYPPVHVNNLSVQIDLPTRGKVGVCEFNSQVQV